MEGSRGLSWHTTAWEALVVGRRRRAGIGPRWSCAILGPVALPAQSHVRLRWPFVNEEGPVCLPHHCQSAAHFSVLLKQTVLKEKDTCLLQGWNSAPKFSCKLCSSWFNVLYWKKLEIFFIRVSRVRNTRTSFPHAISFPLLPLICQMETIWGK